MNSFERRIGVEPWLQVCSRFGNGLSPTTLEHRFDDAYDVFWGVLIEIRHGIGSADGRMQRLPPGFEAPRTAPWATLSDASSGS